MMTSSTNNLISIDAILEALQTRVEGGIPIDASTWLNNAQKMVVLLGDVQDELFLLEQDLAKRRLGFIDSGDSVAKAKVRVETTDEYRHARSLEAKIDRVTELIRTSKLQARMSDDNLKNFK